MFLTNNIQRCAMLHLIRRGGQCLCGRCGYIWIQFLFNWYDSALRYGGHYTWCYIVVRKMDKKKKLNKKIPYRMIEIIIMKRKKNGKWLTQTFWHRISPLAIDLTYSRCVAYQ